MEDNLKRLVSETTRLCRDQNHEGDPYLVAYLACILDVSQGLSELVAGASITKYMEASVVATIAKKLADMVMAKDDPVLAMAKMQVQMEAVFSQQREKVENAQMEHAEQLDMLARVITGHKLIKDNSVIAYEKLYKRMAEYVASASGMELALTEQAAMEEVRAAMESVFPLSMLARFMTLSEEEKLQQLQELARITLGICLYNKSINKGGFALASGPATYLPQAQRLLRDITRSVEDLSTQLAKYHRMMRTGAAVFEAAGPERVRQETGFKSQALVLYETLQGDLQAGLDTVQQLEAEVEHVLMQVHDAVGSTSAVPKELVYPLFDRMGEIHLAMSGELRLLVVRQRLYDQLCSLGTGFIDLLARHAAQNPRRPGAPTEPTAAELLAEQFAETKLQEAPNLGEGVEYLEPSTSAQIAFSGFDPVMIAKDGLLRRANPALGYLSYDGHTYGFATSESLHKFSQSAASVLESVTGVILKQPVVAKLLGRTPQFPVLDLQVVVKTMSGPLKVDFGCQTPVHFVEHHIDYSYEWNEWALRRRALALANLRQKRTHSTQTALTHFKRDAETQAWQPKEAQVQTRANKGQTMPKKLQYVAGLRGAPNTKMNVIRLELELGQPHQH